MAPQAVAGAVAGYLVGAGATYAAYAAVYAITYVVVYAGGVMLLNAAAQALTPDPPRDDDQTRGIGANYTGTTEPRRLIYGEVRVGGMNTIKPILTGSNNQHLHRVLALAGTEVTSIPHVYFDQNTITNDMILPSGAVNTGTYEDNASIRRYIGTSTQSADSTLLAALPNSYWTADHRGRGIAYVAIRHTTDEDAYSSGVPDLKCVVLGRRVYDPRLDSTVSGGAGSHRTNDPSTWTYSTNPALCIRDYLTHEFGGRFSHDEIDDALVIAAANVCDESVSIPGGTQSRYTFNGICYANADFEDTLRQMLAAMNGRCFQRDGKWRIYAGQWDTPTVTIEERDWLEVTRASGSLGQDNRWNAVKGFYVDPVRNYTRQECAPAIDSVFATLDGGRIWTKTENPYCNNEYEMQRQCMLLNRRSRNQAIMIGRLPKRFEKLVAWETVIVNYAMNNWSSKTFRIARMSHALEDGSIPVSLAEEQSSDWDDPDVSDYTEPGEVISTAPSSTIPSIPENFSTQGLGNGIGFNWTPGPIIALGQKFQLFEGSSNTLGTAQLAIDDASPGVVLPKTDNTTFYYWLRAINQNSDFAGYLPASFGTPAAALLPASGAAGDLAIAGISGASKLSTQPNITTGQGQCTATGGTTTVNSPYAFTWEVSSGDTMAISGVNSSRPTWTASGFSINEQRISYWRCFAVDAVPNTVVGGPVPVQMFRESPI